MALLWSYDPAENFRSCFLEKSDQNNCDECLETGEPEELGEFQGRITQGKAQNNSQKETHR